MSLVAGGEHRGGTHPQFEPKVRNDIMRRFDAFCYTLWRFWRTTLHFAKHPLRFELRVHRCGTGGTPQAACWQPPYWCYLPSSLVSPWLSCLSPPLVFWPKMPQDKKTHFVTIGLWILRPPLLRPPLCRSDTYIYIYIYIYIHTYIYIYIHT